MWQGPTFQSYYNQVPQIARSILDKEDSAYLLTVDFDEYLNFLVEEIKWEPLEWDIGAKTVEPYSVKVSRHDHFDRPYSVEEQRLLIRIPLSPHPQRQEYFKYGPSTTWGSQPKFDFEGDVLVLEVGATEQDVERGIKQVNFWLGNRNNDIEAGNKGLVNRVKGVWEAKRKQLEDGFGATNELLKKLNIPLHQDPNARVKPVEIKERQLRTVMEKPRSAMKQEPSLSGEDVAGLVEFIDQYTRQFEVTPTAYASMDEENLRDLLVGMMNVNYPDSTTGETFSKLGKTDISFRVDSGHVLICECKFWAGAKAYGAALDQLFGYITWRQNYGVLIHFSKLKGMSKAIAGAQKATTDHESFTIDSLQGVGESQFLSRHFHPQDPDKALEVFHLFIDLSF